MRVLYHRVPLKAVGCLVGLCLLSFSLSFSETFSKLLIRRIAALNTPTWSIPSRRYRDWACWANNYGCFSIATATVGAQQSLPTEPKAEVDKTRMSQRFYFETSSSGKQQFVSIKRSRSHGHHHKHHHHEHHEHREHHEHEYYKVKRDVWDRMKERERCLEDINKSLIAEVNALKSRLSTAEAEAHHLCHVVVPQLQNQVNVLSADNEALRRSLDNACQNECRHGRDEEALKQTIEKLEVEKKELKAENCSLKDKIKHLQRQVDAGCGRRTSELIREIDYWKEQYRWWKSKFEDTKQRHDDVCVTLEIRTEKMRAYEEILKRRRII